MVAINIVPEQDELIPDWRKEGNYSVPILVIDPDNDVKHTYNLRGTPTNFVLDSRGRIVYESIGYTGTEEEQLESYVRQVLGLPPLAASSSR